MKRSLPVGGRPSGDGRGRAGRGDDDLVPGWLLTPSSLTAPPAAPGAPTGAPGAEPADGTEPAEGTAVVRTVTRPAPPLEPAPRVRPEAPEEPAPWETRPRPVRVIAQELGAAALGRIKGAGRRAAGSSLAAVLP